MAPGNVIEALDARDGTVLWATREAHRPLWLEGGDLLAQRGTELVLLDAATGALTKHCTAGAPPWSPPPIDDALGRTTSLAAADGGGGKVLLWESTSTHYVGGAAPTPEMMAWASSHSVSVVEVTLPACVIRGVPTPPLPAAPEARMVDGVSIAVATEMRGGRTVAVLRRTRAGVALADVVLGDAPPVYAQLLLSADARHVILSVQDAASGRTSTPIMYDVTLFDAVGARSLAAFRTPLVPGAFIVLGGVLVDAAGGGLRAVDAATGALLWTRALRSTGYHGPFPP
jgi:hypothetical protein